MAGGKILFASQYAGFIGGLEIYIHSVAQMLRKNGYRTASLYVEQTKGAEKFLSAFDETYTLDELDKLSEKDFDLTTLHKISEPDVLEKILSKISPTVFVHDHDYFCPKGFKYFPYRRKNCTLAYNRLVCGLCASAVPPRHLTNGVAAAIKKNFFKSAKLCALIKKCPRFVVLSDFMRNELISNSIASEKVFKLHPFLKAEYLRGLEHTSSDSLNIVFAGQQVMSKGTPLFLEAVSKVKSGIHADILGTGLRFADFRAMSENMGLANRVSFRGWVDSPNEYFEKAAIGVFPSLWQEPFGLTGIEEMAAGLPVVAFDVGGVREWLENGVNGLLVPQRDTRAMAAAIDRLCTDKNFRLQMGLNAFNSVREKFSEQKFIQNFTALL